MRDHLDALRRTPDPDAVSDETLSRHLEGVLRSECKRGPISVLNATGIVIHTNLGRAPLAPEAKDAVNRIMLDYTNLEMDLEDGRRSNRNAHIDRLLQQITGAEAGLALNNCAGAVLATLSAIGGGGSAIASRGELVEIGGGFRMPDVIRQSGARLVEVGTTNRTRVSDYEQAIGSDTRLLLKTHTSNFRMIGFTETPKLHDLAALGRRTGIPVVEDLGGGSLIDLTPYGLPHEPTVRTSLEAGADIVLFSGDKLMGGPQAGLIVGRKRWVDEIAAHPLSRALRLDKLSLAALAATLRLYLHPDVETRIPVLQMLTQPLSDITRRADRLLELLKALPDAEASVVVSESYAGGGAMPMHPLESRAVKLRPLHAGASESLARLRTGEPPVVARIEDGSILLDARTLRDEDVRSVAEAVERALG
jgi:L-seryl-tRNA(Ser) seleniumtransferase